MRRPLLLAMLLILVFAISGYAQQGPPIGGLMKLDTAKWDVSKATKVADREAVLHRISKTPYVRDIYQVPELQQTPRTVFAVKETQVTTRQRVVEDRQETPVWVVVEKGEELKRVPTWQYVSKGGIQ